jgi:drug/metabolite transporter (DMT)-like permease
LYAAIAMVCFASMQLVFKVLSRQGINSAVFLLFIFAFGTILYLVHVRATRTPVTVSMPLVGLFAAAAALSYVGNLYSVRAIASAPNAGYAVAIVSLQAAVVTFASVLWLGAALSWIKVFGVLLCCVGVGLMVM